MLKLLFPRLEAQVMVAKHVQLIEPLQEVQIHEGDASFLQPQCQFILGNTSALYPYSNTSQYIVHLHTQYKNDDP